jgi:hypothetical protein
MGLVMDMTSSDSTVLFIGGDLGYGQYELDGFGIGTVWVRLSTYAYGRVLSDSMQVTVGAPHLYGVTSAVVLKAKDGISSELRFYPDSLTVPSGSDIRWYPPPECPPTTSDPNNTACKGTWIDITFDDPQYVLASRIPPAYGATADVFIDLLNSQNPYVDWLRLEYNETGGSGNIPSFGAVAVDSRVETCRIVVPLNCTYGGAAQARLFVRPGRYPYHVTEGPVGVKGAKGIIIVE